MTRRLRAGRTRVSALLLVAALAGGACSIGADRVSTSTETLLIRGRAQTLHTYGSRGGDPVIVSSGDGGWIHLGPHIAESLAAHGFFVVGFDVKAYLSDFTSSSSTLGPDDVPRDFKALLDFAAAGSGRRPVLVGVSEGAGLSVLAATDPGVKASAAGVIAVGLPTINELGWRWRDSVIYLTHGVPNEPTFLAAPFIPRVSPLPLVSIHSTHDEFVALEDEKALMAQALEPKRLWVIDAANHDFSNNLGELDARLLEAITWIRGRAAS